MERKMVMTKRTYKDVNKVLKHFNLEYKAFFVKNSAVCNITVKGSENEYKRFKKALINKNELN